MQQSQKISYSGRAYTMFLSLFIKRNSKSIGGKLLLSVLTVSSIFVIVQTFLQLKGDYDNGVSEVDSRLHQIELSYHDSLSKSIWEVNNSQILSTINGIRALPDVVRVIVTEYTEDEGTTGSHVLAEVGVVDTERFVEQSVPIKVNYLDKEVQIGQLIVIISLDSLYQELYGTVSFILIFQMIKTFLMSAFILGIFHYLVTRHLVSMAKFSREISLDNLDEKLVLERTSNSEDEIAAMSSALNDMKANLKKLLKTNQDSLQMKIELEQQAEREAIQQQYNEKIETQNSMLAQSNTELESAIDELKSTQNKLVNAEKMAALGGMVQGVAHELNTPIGLSITGTSHIKSDTSRIVELLGAGKMKKSDLDSYFSTVMDLSGSISTSLEKAASLIRSFKLVSVEQHEEVLQTFNVHGNLTDILHSINRSLVEKGVVIDNQIPQELSVGSYPGVFYQIYTNLINNALLHAFEGRSEGHIWIAAQMQGDHLSLSFKDDGCGMSDDVLAKLFDPFFTTKRANGGTGLGMNIVYNLVHEKLFGTIDVVSEEGAGTTFTILVPDMRPVEGEQPGQDMLSQAT